MKRNILLVEDQEQWHRAIRRLLPTTDYQLSIITADKNSSQGDQDLQFKTQEYLEQGSIDIVITNVNLLDEPEVPHDHIGLMLLEYVRDNYPSIPRIVISGDTLLGPILSTCKSLDVDEIFIKGHFVGTELYNAIDKAIIKRGESINSPTTPTSIVLTNEKRKEITELVGQNYLDEALDILCTIERYLIDATLVRLRLSRTYQQERRGTIDQSQVETRCTQIAKAILDLICP